ncbi:MAG: EamA family transporter [Ruminiclostridium sp.]|nr:EamA family transporter [Ruminiclostridium sp.]MBQ9852092.1 EamA family transporter [Ruminiclostridium sp.]MBQ9933149.1 EamA family transporter [Ruminiclostridium sp.]
MSSRKGLLFVFIAAILFSIGGLCVKVIPWNAMAINSFRSIVSVILLLIFAKVTGRKFKLTPGVLIGAVSMCGVTTLYAMANKLTTAANTILLQFTAPVFVILVMWLVFKERPKRLDVITCIAVFGGVACFFLDSLGSGSFVGDVLAVLSGVCYAGVFMMNKFPGGDPLFATILGQVMGAVIGFPWLIQETVFTGTALAAALALGIFQLGVAYMFFTTGIRYASPIAASLVAGIEPILNPVLVAVVLGEMITPLSLVGGVIVFVSIMAYNIVGAKMDKKKAQAEAGA